MLLLQFRGTEFGARELIVPELLSAFRAGALDLKMRMGALILVVHMVLPPFSACADCRLPLRSRQTPGAEVVFLTYAADGFCPVSAFAKFGGLALGSRFENPVHHARHW